MHTRFRTGAVPFRWCWGASLCGLAITLWVAVLAAPAQAMTLREMRALEKSDRKQGDLYVRYYLAGAMEGVIEASAQVQRDGGRPLVCLAGRRLEPHRARALLDGELRRNPDTYEADMSVELVLTQALRSAYPCD